jgi:beta-glucuronidase
MIKILIKRLKKAPIGLGLYTILGTFWAFTALAQAPKSIPLNGEWRFVLDPVRMGEKNEWYSPKINASTWDKVSVPHSFTADARYQFYMGAAWYRRTFSWQPNASKKVLLHFDAVFYQCSVWLNGRKVGTHEGGYTPFYFDISEVLKSGENTLYVAVDNDTSKPGTVPGAKDTGMPNAGFPGWVNYGGITRSVYLTTEPSLYIENLKVEATPDLVAQTAIVKIKARVKNAGSQAITPKITLQLTQNQQVIPLKWTTKTLSVQPNQTAILEAEASLKPSEVKLWDIDEPNLYEVQVVANTDTAQTHFGIRKVEVKNAQLLLNGQPIKVAGGNRVLDYPKLGSVEPDWLIDKDLRLMKETGMELHRLTHYTPSEAVYDWADRHGMLIITEAGNWQLTPNQMDTDSIRQKFRSQFKEMVERDWNHPCVIAYSVGNEYLSETPSGQRWTKDMIAYARELDPTRLYTFASYRLNLLPKKPEDEASQYCDFVSTNTYGNHLKVLQHIHALYPEKPIFISEYGTRADGKDGEAGQITHLEKFLSEIRTLPYVVGASWWSFNDYQSRYLGTNPNGLRPWGLVNFDRSPRALYAFHQQEMSPVKVEKVSFKQGNEGVHRLRLRITSRGDFPAYTLKKYILSIDNQRIVIPELQPAQSIELDVVIRGFESTTMLEIHKPTGFVILKQTIETKE